MLQSLSIDSIKDRCKIYSISNVHVLYVDTNFRLLLVRQRSQIEGASLISIINVSILKLLFIFNFYFLYSPIIYIYVNTLNINIKINI